MTIIILLQNEPERSDGYGDYHRDDDYSTEFQLLLTRRSHDRRQQQLQWYDRRRIRSWRKLI